MRFEGAGLFWLVGMVIVPFAWMWTQNLGYNKKRWIRSIVMSLGLGVSLFTSADAYVVAPSTHMLILGLMATPKVTQHLTLGILFFLGNWICAFFALGLWKPKVGTEENKTEVKSI